MVAGRGATAADPVGHTGKTIRDFWEWAFGDLVTNTVRSVFAEYLVALALDVIDPPRLEWDQYDLMYRRVGIEVKRWTPAGVACASATRHATLRYRCQEGLGRGDEHEATTSGRSAAVWVFAECTPTVASLTLVADIDQWRFHATSTLWLNEHWPTQNSISTSELTRLLPSVAFLDLRAAVDAAIDHP